MKKLKYFAFVILTLAQVHQISAATYMVTQADYGEAGTVFYYRSDFEMVVGKNVFGSFSELLSVSPEKGSTVYVEPGTYTEDFTVNVDGLTFLGNNAWCESRTGTRKDVETVITGKITVEADNVTINGFRFTGNGCVVNETATTESPLSGFKFIYNDVTGSTLERNKDVAVVKIGNQYGDSNGGLDAAAHCRYNGVTVSHNSFTGSDASPAHFVHVGGSYGVTNIVDNTFNDGGSSVTLANSQGEINVLNNTFTNVGNLSRYFGETNGELAVYLYYIAYSNTTTVNIKNNVFDNCLGRSTMYAPVRFFNGDTSKPQLSPVGCRINLNYNIFKNKAREASRDYNYIFYTNYNEEADIDTRFNQFDNGDMVIGLVKQPWEDEAKRNMASSYELIDFASSKYTELSYYKDPTGKDVKALSLEKSVRVAQSFDVDEKTGDIFFVQIYPESSWNGIKLNAEEPLVVTRYYKNSDGVMDQQRMYLDNAGHGSNMAVCWYNGKRYIVTGGDGEVVNGNTQSNCSSFIPYAAGSVADCSKTSFNNSDGTKTFEIKKFYNPLGNGNPYPSVDQTSRLFLERNTSGSKVRLCIYNLDDVIEQGGDATPLKVVTIKKATSSAEGDNPNPNNITGDRGFQTWDPQGLTISGDYLYFNEGVGEGNEEAIDGQPTVVVSAYNWRTDKFAYRKRIKASTILNLVHGEPEGIKVHRDDKGRPCLLVGIATGASGARKANIFSYLPAPNSTSSTGMTFDIPVGVSTPSVSAIDFNVSLAGTYSQAFTVDNAIKDGGENATLNGELQFTVAGEDASCFDVSAVNAGAFDKTSTVTVNYTPNTATDNHSAVLRISSPNAEDVLVPLSGSYSGVLTGIDDTVSPGCTVMYQNENNIWLSDETIPVRIYDMAGVLREEGIGQVATGELSKGVYLVKYGTNVRKIVL